MSRARSWPPGTTTKPTNAETASKPHTTDEAASSLGDRATLVGDESLQSVVWGMSMHLMALRIGAAGGGRRWAE